VKESLPHRIHLSYVEPTGQMSAPECVASVEAADRLIRQQKWLAGRDPGRRRVWHLSPCDCVDRR
jgi:hypothetical protein